MFGRRIVPYVIAVACAVSAAAISFPQDAEARVVCRTYTEGNQRVTEFCQDGYLCDLEARKCRPGPEARRKLEAERARKLAEVRKRQSELRERIRNALKQNRRTEPARPAAAPGTGQNPFNCSYKPAGGGAAWDAMCLDTVMSDPRKLAGLRCNPGEICPRGAGGIVVDNSVRRPAAAAAGVYTPGTWYAPSDDWRRVPSPQYHRATASPPAQAAPPRQSLRERLRMRLRYGEAESQINRLIAERNKHARASAAWEAMNDALKELDRTLSANGYDLSATFHSQGVYGGGDQDGGTGSGGGNAAARGDQTPADNAAPPAADNATPPADQSSGDQQAAKAEPDKPKRSARDETMCGFILYRVHQNDPAYHQIGQIPEACRDDVMQEALAEQSRMHPTIILDSSDREEIRRMISEVEALRGQAPPGE